MDSAARDRAVLPGPRSAGRRCQRLAALQADLRRQLALAGPHDGAYVYDVTAKQALFSERATTHAPAGLGGEALHGHGGARPDGPGCAPDDECLRSRPAGTGRDLGRQPLPARRRRSDLRQQLVHRLPLRRGRRERACRLSPRSSRRRASTTSPARSRAMRPSSTPARRALQRLRARPVPRRDAMVHRDVKPANMLVDRRSNRSDHVYLADFGLSKKRLTASAGLTGTGQFVGTLDYSAPEQIRGRPADGRTDQYALACAAFELLTGAPPFHHEEATAVMYAHLSEPPPPVTSRRAGLPRAMWIRWLPVPWPRFQLTATPAARSSRMPCFKRSAPYRRAPASGHQTGQHPAIRRPRSTW